MANSDKNILITPNRNLSGIPEIAFTGAGNSSISIQVADSTTAQLNFVSAGSSILTIDANNSSGSLLDIQNLSSVSTLNIPSIGDITINADTIIPGHGIVLPSYGTTSVPPIKEGLIYYDNVKRGINVGTTTSIISYSSDTDIVRSGMLLNLHPSSFYNNNVSNNIWPDIRGNGQFMYQQNGPTYSSTNGGVIDMAGASSQYFYSPQSIYWSDIKTVTFDMWFQTNTASLRQGLISTHAGTGGSNQDSIEIEIQAAGNSFAGFRSTNGSFYSVLYNTNFSLNTWHCICVVLDGYRIRYYVNGTSVGTSAWPQTLVTNSSGSALHLGKYENHYLRGKIGEFKMYHIPLKDSEIKQNFEATRGRFGI